MKMNISWNKYATHGLIVALIYALYLNCHFTLNQTNFTVATISTKKLSSNSTNSSQAFSGTNHNYALYPIKSSSATWSKSEAVSELEIDLRRASSFCDRMKKNQKQKLIDQKVFKDYEKTREHNLRDFATQSNHYAGLLSNFPGITDSQRNKFYFKMIDIVLMINATFTEMESYVEGVRMRGWPFLIHSDVSEFDSYHNGHLIEAVALAAEQAALRGDSETAISLTLTVAAALHDGFLTKDLRRTKVREHDGSVIYVPKSAPEDRTKRFLEVHNYHSLFLCPNEPQAINHGLASANAGIGLLRAFGAIGWLDSTSDSKSSWHLVDADGIEISLSEYLDDLKNFVSRSAKVFMRLCDIRKTKIKKEGKNRIKRPVSDGSEWYWWKYKKVDKSVCPSFKNAGSNRPEDIGHAEIELRFVDAVRAVGKDYFAGNPDYFGISDKDIHRLLVSVLVGFITDPAAKVGDRFACDLNGNSDPMSKSCSHNRMMPEAQLMLPPLLYVAIAARDNPKARCDALRLVDAILPIFLEDHEDFRLFEHSNHYDIPLPLLLTKYLFYWYENGVTDCQKQ